MLFNTYVDTQLPTERGSYCFRNTVQVPHKMQRKVKQKSFHIICEETANFVSKDDEKKKIEWCFMPLSTVFQSYHGNSSHYSHQEKKENMFTLRHTILSFKDPETESFRKP